VSNDFAKHDADLRSAELDKIAFGISEALIYGAKTVRIFAGDVKEGMDFESARQWIVEGLCDASSMAHPAGIRLALENHGQLAGKSDQLIPLVEQVRQITGTSCLTLNPDTGNFLLVDESSVSSLIAALPLASMVHLKDFRRVDVDAPGASYHSLAGNAFAGVRLGSGDVDVAGCLSAIRDQGFDGWVSLEYEGDEDPLTAIPASLEVVRNLV
jgi:sugar phosphate isomerase/epimerase